MGQSLCAVVYSHATRVTYVVTLLPAEPFWFFFHRFLVHVSSFFVFLFWLPVAEILLVQLMGLLVPQCGIVSRSPSKPFTRIPAPDPHRFPPQHHSHGSMQSVPTEARRGHPGKMPRQITTHRGVTSTRPAPEHRPHSTHKPTASMRDAPPEGKHTLAAAHGAPTNATKVVPTKVRTEVSQGSAH